MNNIRIQYSNIIIWMGPSIPIIAVMRKTKHNLTLLRYWRQTTDIFGSWSWLKKIMRGKIKKVWTTFPPKTSIWNAQMMSMESARMTKHFCSSTFLLLFTQMQLVWRHTRDYSPCLCWESNDPDIMTWMRLIQ